MAQLAVAVVTPKDAQRVEDIPEDARLQQRGDVAVGRGNVAIGEEGFQSLAQRRFPRLRNAVGSGAGSGAGSGVSEMVVGVESREGSQPPRQPGELVDIDIP